MSRISVARRIVTGTRSLREHTARGTLINGLFQVFLASLTFARGFIVAAFLSRSDFGIWGILVVGLGSLQWLKGSGVSDKYVQQTSEDDEQAFQTAFTVETILTLSLAALTVCALPILALIYGEWRIIAPGLVMALVLIPMTSLQSPQWVFYRKMDFVRQRTLQAADPVTSFVATIGLAIAGAGYWSLVLGQLVGSTIGSILTLRAAPYRLAWRSDRRAMREYFSFSWPLAVAGGSAILIAQGSLLIVNSVLGLAAVGMLSLAAQISGYADGVDAIVTGTLYPAICVVQDRIDLLFESFVKSNRLALMWGVPFGVGMAVFATQIVQFGVGEQWRPAITLIRVFGITAASHQIGFNWTAFYSARNNNRPLAVVNTVLAVTLLATGIPLTIAYGLLGMGIALLIMIVVGLAGRTFYLVRLFPSFHVLRHMVRGVVPTIPATGATLCLRLATGVPRTLSGALVEVVVYIGVTGVATWFFERELIRELVGYLRGGRGGLFRGATSSLSQADA